MVIAPTGRQGAGRRVVSQLFRDPAGGRDEVDLFITIILAGERDPFSVRRKFGKKFLSGMSGQTHGLPSLR